ncbi:DUF917 domain-containing protein [Pseudothermotoga elfii]|uniref:DUF917 domain-containing protein n=1 Tax=Pseudothermotoga elfii TaxID=38322 RepID=UPI00040F7981|nr:DUF917 domain-containing protein [Pseudothermotoga elfii]
MRILHKEDLEVIVNGAAFLGAGGGGPVGVGRYLIERIEKETGSIEIELITTDEMSDYEFAVMVAGIGSPKIIKEKGFGCEALYAYEFIRKICAISGMKVKYVMPGEMGGFNTLVSVYVSGITKTPLIDADGNGRAVPELSTTLYYCAGIPSVPLVLADSSGDIAVVYLGNETDHKTAESVARNITVSWGMAAAFSTWPVRKHEITKYLVAGSISRAKKIGEILRRFGGKSIEELSKKLSIMGIKELFVGCVRDINSKTEKGFDCGIVSIEGKDKYSGLTMNILFKNENILAQIDGKHVAMVPDLISFIDAETGEVLTNAEITSNQKIVVYGMPAPKKWKQKPSGFESWKHILQDFGYSGEYLSLD